MKPAVFLDRDGVLVKNINHDYIREKTQIELLPFAKQAVDELFESGFKIVIVTNQACVGKGFISIDDALIIQNEIVNQLDPDGSKDLKSELCPHTNEERCSCRKPQPGMVVEAGKKYKLDLPKSYMVGDALSDIKASLASGVKPIFVLSGRGKTSDLDGINHPIQVFDHIGSAANYICGSLR